MPPNTIASLVVSAPRSSAKETGRRKKLSEKIEKLGAIEHGEIFRKLKMHSLGYTQNNNGIFFDITDLPGEIVDEIALFVDHCIENQKMLKTSRQNQFKLPSGKTVASSNIGDDGADRSLSQEIETQDLGDSDSNCGLAAGVPEEPFRYETKVPEALPIKKPSSKFQHTRKNIRVL